MLDFKRKQANAKGRLTQSGFPGRPKQIIVRAFQTLKLFIAVGLSISASAAPVRVELKEVDSGWQLLREGRPFYVKGVGGNGSLKLLKESGGNSVRTWKIDNRTEALLDEAQGLGLTVTLGVWLGHERHGFSYTSYPQVTQQMEAVRRAVLKYKDHPAVLCWALGNEMEGYAAGDNPAIWSHIESLGAMVKKLDPHHPTMTVIAEIGGNRVDAIHNLCPNIDIIGINAYGGATSLPKRYREQGGTKPYIVAEYGPHGPWEIRPNPNGFKDESTSTAKAAGYWNAYQSLAADGKRCLGSYAFLWGSKMEFTATWFGMLLPDGNRLEAADTMRRLWSGQAVPNRCPTIKSLAIVDQREFKPRESIEAKLMASDRESDSLSVRWVLMAEADEQMGGDFQATPPGFSGSIVFSGADSAKIVAPESGGVYRLYAYVFDGHGGAATANVPFFVKGPTETRPAKKVQLPFSIYSDSLEAPTFVASGWMGSAEAIMMDEHCEERPKVGSKCLRVEYRKGTDWGGAVWQHPPNDWGDLAGGFDLTGAKKLKFWARGAQGGEKVKFGFGIIGSDKPYPDSSRDEQEFTLTEKWQALEFDLSNKDLSRLKSGFMWAVSGQGTPVTFYLDEIRYE